MGPVTKQDVLSIVEMSRNRIFERVATKQDITVLADTIRQLTSMHQQSQQLLRQSEYQRLQLSRRATAVETRLGQIENELRTLQNMVGRVAERKPQQIIMPTPATPATEREASVSTQYVYRPQ